MNMFARQRIKSPEYRHMICIGKTKCTSEKGQLKFEKTDNVFIKSIHSGLWQNFVSLLAQMVVEQEADKLFS